MPSMPSMPTTRLGPPGWHLVSDTPTVLVRDAAGEESLLVTVDRLGGADRPAALAAGHLIAAAPDLLQTLRDLLPWAEGHHDGTKACDCDRCEALRAARAAIALAEGQAP